MKLHTLFSSGLLIFTPIYAWGETYNYSDLEKVFKEPVCASATGRPLLEKDVPLSMDIISHQYIQRSGARDIPELLRRLVGVDVARSYKNHADVTIRGYGQPTSGKILLLVNGKSKNLETTGAPFFEFLDIHMNEIYQIEVIRGPNSALYGFGAENGVINIITHSPLNDDVDMIGGSVGTQQSQGSYMIHTLKLGEKHGLRLSTSVKNSDGFNKDSLDQSSGIGNTFNAITLPFKSNNEYISRAVHIDYMGQLNTQDSIRVESGFSNGNTRSLIYYLVPANVRAHLGNQSIEYQRDTGKYMFTAQAKHNSIDNMPTTAERSFSEVDSWGGKLSFLSYKGKHTFRLLGEYIRTDAHGTVFDNTDGSQGQIITDTFSLGGMLSHNFTPKLSLTNSIRYDHLETTREGMPASPYSFSDYNKVAYEEVSFNSALLYKLNAHDRIRFSVGRGVHIPSILEMGMSLDLGGGSETYGNPFLDPEVNTTFEVGYSHIIPEYNLTWDAAVFFQRHENLIRDKIPNPLDSTFVNSGDSNMVGLELSLKKKEKNYHWGASYNTHLIQDQPIIGESMTFEGDARHRVSLYGGYDYKNWSFDGDLHFTSASRQRLDGGAVLGDSTISQDLPAYWILNTRIAYKLSPKATIELIGENLLQRHREYLNGPNDIYGVKGANTIGPSGLIRLNYRY